MNSPGYFVDENGRVRSVAAPGPGNVCKVDGDKVTLLGEIDPTDGREVLGEYDHFADLADLRARGFEVNAEGFAAELPNSLTSPNTPSPRTLKSPRRAY